MEESEPAWDDDGRESETDDLEIEPAPVAKKKASPRHKKEKKRPRNQSPHVARKKMPDGGDNDYKEDDGHDYEINNDDRDDDDDDDDNDDDGDDDV